MRGTHRAMEAGLHVLGADLAEYAQIAPHGGDPIAPSRRQSFGTPPRGAPPTDALADGAEWGSWPPSGPSGARVAVAACAAHRSTAPWPPSPGLVSPPDPQSPPPPPPQPPQQQPQPARHASLPGRLEPRTPPSAVGPPGRQGGVAPFASSPLSPHHLSPHHL